MIFSPQKMQQNFSRAAQGYDSQAQFQQQQMRRVLQRARQVVPAGARVLDIGCGTGLLAHEARDAQWHITGLDAAISMCGVAKSRCDAVVRADASALPFGNGVFDAVVSSLCVQWVADKSAAFGEIHRVLKAGATAVIATLGSETLHELRAQAVAANVKLSLLPFATSAEYAQWAEQSGFELQALEDAPQIHEYPNARALLESMRRIGAGSAQTKQARSIAPQKMLRMLRDYDKNHASANGVMASWQPILLQMRKAL